MQPRKVQLDDQLRPCLKCGLPSARLKRLDHYLSLFFIPLIPVKRGEPFLECERCGGIFSEGGQPTPTSFFWSESPKTCPRCRRDVDPEFNFCPYCGQKIF